MSEQLRFFTLEGQLVPTPEKAEERQRANAAEAKVKLLQQKLRELGS